MITEQRLLEALDKRTGTAREIAERIPCCHEHARAIFRMLHLRGWVHIRTWRRGRQGPASPVFAIGPGKDAPRPASLTAAQKCKRYREQLRQRFGENYGVVHAAMKQKIPGRQIIVEGKVVYQQ